MGCGASSSEHRGFSTEKTKLPIHVKRMLLKVEKESPYSFEELERLWFEFSNLADGRSAEKLVYAFLTKHKFGNQLIFMILESRGLNPEATEEQADPLALFPLCAEVLGVLRKGGVAEQLQWYFHLFDINDDGTLEPEEVGNMVKVLLENNPAMVDVVTSETTIKKMVEDIFTEADDNDDGVLSLKEFLAHSRFITKKILLQNTSFVQRTTRMMRRMHGEGMSEGSVTRFSSNTLEIV